MMAMLFEWLTNPWFWLSLGMILLILEIFVLPTTWFMWFGISAFAAAGLVAIQPELDWKWVLLFYSIVSMIVLYFGKRYFSRGIEDDETSRSNLNQRTRQYIGREVELVEAIVNGIGRAKLGDTTWRVSGPDSPAGERLRVIDVNGATLVVGQLSNEPAEPEAE